jgi:soluble P-type ATPase
MKSGIRIDIPGFGHLHIQAICSDYTGTPSCEGEFIDGVRERLLRLAELVDIHVVTSDTRKTASEQLKGLPITLHDKITSDDHDVFKRDYLTRLGTTPGVDLQSIAVFGNGRNDRLWLAAVRDVGGLAIAVDVGEGCAVEAMMSASVFVVGIRNALDLLLDSKRIVGTLRTRGDNAKRS